MSDTPTAHDGKTDPPPGRAGNEGEAPPAFGPSIPAGADATKAGEPIPANSLTPAEQMERFAKELKENDWGHQPC